MDRRTFISGMLTGMAFPSEVLANEFSKDTSFYFKRNYSFSGKLSAEFITLPFEIFGNLNFLVEKGNSEATIECFNSWQKDPFLSIYSEGYFKNRVLIPKKTIAREKIVYFPFFMDRRTTLTYENKGLVVNGIVKRFKKDGSLKRISPKHKEHDESGLDYASSVLNLLVNTKQENLPESMNMITTSGNLSKNKLHMEKSDEGRLEISLRKSKFTNISLNLEHGELSSFYLSHKYGGINAEISRTV